MKRTSLGRTDTDMQKLAFGEFMRAVELRTVWDGEGECVVLG
jgi:hypothetical protein